MAAPLGAPETYRAPLAVGRWPLAEVRSPKSEVRSPKSEVRHNFLKFLFKPVKAPFFWDPVPERVKRLVSTHSRARILRRAASPPSGIKVQVSYKQYSEKTISMFHVEQFFLEKTRKP